MLTGLDSDDPATNAANHTAAVYRAHKDRFAKWGLQIYRVQKADVCHSPPATPFCRPGTVAAFSSAISSRRRSLKYPPQDTTAQDSTDPRIVQ